MRSATERPTPSSFCSSFADAVLMLILSFVSLTAALEALESAATATAAGLAASTADKLKVMMRRIMRVLPCERALHAREISSDAIARRGARAVNVQCRARLQKATQRRGLTAQPTRRRPPAAVL